ncbi:hypothetical protein PRK78_002865 [Emydomyces testavorans]|uniref:GPI anchored protein n=1 Tax=Emydomyces testavorans TaxID=2070801 RepID=A0AAF0DFQ5_9EURO|nr:hypothetical protein PRK78_002865 [Emydomyces testavorans]
MQLQTTILHILTLLSSLIPSPVAVAAAEDNNLRIAAVHITSIIARAPDNLFARQQQQLASCPEATQTLCPDGNGCCPSGVDCTTSRGLPVCNIACIGTECPFGGCCPRGYECDTTRTACVRAISFSLTTSLDAPPPLPTFAPVPTEFTTGGGGGGGGVTQSASSKFSLTIPRPTSSSSEQITETSSSSSSSGVGPTSAESSQAPRSTSSRVQSATVNAGSAVVPLSGFMQLLLSGLGLIFGGL